MKKGLLLLALLLSLICTPTHAQTDTNPLRRLYTFAGENFNYSSPSIEADITPLASAQEALAREQKDYRGLFFIQQTIVNAYSLKGDIGLAVNKAQKMYEEAKKVKSDVGIALSIQAIGNTYMNSSQNEQAYATYSEAYQILRKTNCIFLKIRLLIQQIHTCMLVDRSEEMQDYLIETRKLLDRAEIPDKAIYAFYLQCYQTFYNISIKDEELARISLEEIKGMKLDSQIFNRWYYFLLSRYYDLKGDYGQALLYCDSTKQLVLSNKNLNEYKALMLNKANLLVKNRQKAEACELYDETRILADSLNMIRYSKQIDSLHVNYWVDQMEIENTAIQNRFLGMFIALSILLLITASVLLFVALKKNRKLIESRKRLEKTRQETAESIQSKSLFLSNMSHELRTPLNAIVGFADLLSMEAVDDAESKLQFGERIRQNADLLLKLFNDVADLSALKGKAIKFSYGSCNVVPLCQNVIDTVEKVKQTPASLHFKTNLNDLTIHTDSARLQQVLINLLVNATKFTQEGSITLILEPDEEHQEAIFTVEDTGCGIPLEKQPHIFERFEKLHEGVQGAGLGLSICQLIVEHVGGRIWIDSQYTQGARFVFTHPLTDLQKQTEV